MIFVFIIFLRKGVYGSFVTIGLRFYMEDKYLYYKL